MTLLNGLGYNVKIAGIDKPIPAGQEIKLTPQEIPCKKMINGRAVCHIHFVDSPSLPPEIENTFYVVTSQVAQCFTNRKDLLTLQFKGAQRNAVQPNEYDSYPGLVSIYQSNKDIITGSNPTDEEATNYEIVNTLGFPVKFQDGNPIDGKNLNCMLVGNDMPMEPINGFPVVWTNYTKATNLPEPKLNTLYVVSKLVADMIKDRYDLISPNTFFSPLDSNKKPLFATGFVAPAHNKRFD